MTELLLDARTHLFSQVDQAKKCVHNVENKLLTKSIKLCELACPPYVSLHRGDRGWAEVEGHHLERTASGQDQE